MGKHSKDKKDKGGLGFPKKPPKGECWECKGTGMVGNKTCPTCKGTGEVTH